MFLQGIPRKCRGLVPVWQLSLNTTKNENSSNFTTYAYLIITLPGLEKNIFKLFFHSEALKKHSRFRNTRKISNFFWKK